MTIGGAAGQIVTAHTEEELIAYASSPAPLVIRICGTLRAPVVRVASHKTLLGVGSGATLEGGLLVGGESEYVRNVVVKNLRVNAASSHVSLEAVRLSRAHHVWIDHCELLDAAGDAAIRGRAVHSRDSTVPMRSSILMSPPSFCWVAGRLGAAAATECCHRSPL